MLNAVRKPYLYRSSTLQSQKFSKCSSSFFCKMRTTKENFVPRYVERGLGRKRISPSFVVSIDKRRRDPFTRSRRGKKQESHNQKILNAKIGFDTAENEPSKVSVPRIPVYRYRYTNLVNHLKLETGHPRAPSPSPQPRARLPPPPPPPSPEILNISNGKKSSIFSMGRHL